MTTTISFALLGALRSCGSLLLLAGAAAGPPTAGTPTVEEILEHHAAARGGYEKLKAVRSVIYRGTYREGGQVAMPHAAMALMRPYYKLVGDPEHPDPDFAEGYDGSAWELYGDPGIVLRTVGAASEAARHATRIGGPLIDAADAGSTVTLEGAEQIDGRKAYRLLVVPHRGELSDTLGFVVRGPRRTLLYVPDTDSWTAWALPLPEVLRRERVEVALLDGTFYSPGELPDRDVRKIGHPLMSATMELLREPVRGGLQVFFTHLNHSNPVLDPSGPERRALAAVGFRVLEEGQVLEL